MQVQKVKCFHKIDKAPEEEDYNIIFIPSGFKGCWIKVWELYDSSVDVKYASPEENAELNERLL